MSICYCSRGTPSFAMWFNLAFFLFASVTSHITKVPPLLIVSFDGFRWDYLDRTYTPNFDWVKKNGVHAKNGLKNVFTTSTLTNHWSMVTGLYAESHGIIENEMFDPIINQSFIPLYKNRHYINDPRFYDVPGVEPIWVTNQVQKGGRSGSIMWWGAEYRVKLVRPTYHMPYNKGTNPYYKIDTLIKLFTNNYPINLGLLYFSDPDETAHKWGPESPEVTEQIKRADNLTGYLLQELRRIGLLDDLNLIITSDHGFVSVSKDRLIKLDDFVKPEWFMVVHYTPVASIIPHPGYEDTVYNNLKSAAPSNHFRVFKKAEIPEEWHYKHNIRVPPITAIADLSYSFLINMTADKFVSAGMHGFDNAHHEMYPFFMAMGPSIKSDFKVDMFNSVDIYPFMCNLLHLKPNPHNGSLKIVSQFLEEGHETTLWTFSTYIFCLIIIASVGGVFVVAPCRHHRYLKPKLNQLRVSTTGYVKSSLSTGNGARVRLLSDEEDDDEF